MKIDLKQYITQDSKVLIAPFELSVLLGLMEDFPEVQIVLVDPNIENCDYAKELNNDLFIINQDVQNLEPSEESKFDAIFIKIDEQNVSEKAKFVLKSIKHLSSCGIAFVYNQENESDFIKEIQSDKLEVKAYLQLVTIKLKS